MPDAEDIKHGLLRIVAYLPFIKRKLEDQPTVSEGSDLVYTDSTGRTHVIADMPNGYLHSAAAKLKREGRQLKAVAAMEVEIAKREAARER